MKRSSRDESPLFSGGDLSREPLASRMRPRTLDEFAGQGHILGPGRLLRRAVQADRLSSLIFSGPPGTGKTTLARIIANTTSSRFVSLNAVLCGVQDLRDAVDGAKAARELHQRRTILFVDEVHRWNKSQQDALLPWVENGTVILVGATTENPFFEVNKALVSRSRVFEFQRLTSDDLEKVLDRALLDPERGYGAWNVSIDVEARKHLLDVSSGDARTLLNALELAIETSVTSWPPEPGAEVRVTMADAEESIQKRAILHDKDGDYHFDTVSALIKSIRGSDPDATMYWLARMIRCGEDPDFIFRRLLVSACEDIGLAEPRAISVVSSCAEAFSRTGFPEGNFHLAHAALYLANCPKSNSVMGFFKAMAAVEAEDAEVPNHLKDPSRDKEGFGHGEGYRYPHEYKGHWVPQDYLPETLRETVFYVPSNEGWEATIAARVAERREAALALATTGQSPGPGGDGSGTKGRDAWYRRLSEKNHASMLAARDALLSMAPVGRNSRVLVLASDSGALVWECARRAGDGLVVGACEDAKTVEEFSRYARQFSGPDAPHFTVAGAGLAERLEDETGTREFDVVFGSEALRNPKGTMPPPKILARLLVPGGVLATTETVPRDGTRLSEVIALSPSNEALARELAALEEAFRAEPGETAGAFLPETAKAALATAGFIDITMTRAEEERVRLVTPREAEAWSDPARHPFLAWAARTAGEDLPGRVQKALAAVVALRGETGIPWRTAHARFRAFRGTEPRP